MNSSQIATAIVLRDLNCGSLDSIGDRILLQKKVFLAQDFGMPLGYGFNWYLHGPYSPDLTRDAFQIIPEGPESIQNMKLKPEYESIIRKVKELEFDISEKIQPISVVLWYELVASIAYWHKRGIADKNDMLKKIKETKPHFSEDQIRDAFTSYKKLKETA